VNTQFAHWSARFVDVDPSQSNQVVYGLYAPIDPSVKKQFVHWTACIPTILNIAGMTAWVPFFNPWRVKSQPMYATSLPPVRSNDATVPDRPFPSRVDDSNFVPMNRTLFTGNVPAENLTIWSEMFSNRQLRNVIASTPQ
jgi:hypothetical protein